MSETYNIYCDESCHLENDHESVMVLGAIWCPVQKIPAVSSRIREIKIKHGLPKNFEIKWKKISPALVDFYMDLLDFFFDDDDLHFRAVVADKEKLCHAAFGQDHDTWYYKMYFTLLNVILDPSCRYRIFLDIKDTRSISKIRKLQEVLHNNAYDFARQIIQLVQQIRSHEVELLPLADLLIGAVSYANRRLDSSRAKSEVMNRVKQRCGYTLTRTTLLREDKFNIFIWNPQEPQNEL